jgi:hypothetical protein
MSDERMKHELSQVRTVAAAIAVPVCVLIAGITSCNINSDNQRAAVEIAKAEARKAALERGAAPVDVRCMEAASNDPICVVQAGRQEASE